MTTKATTVTFDRADLIAALTHAIAHASSDHDVVDARHRHIQLRREQDAARVRFAATDGKRLILYSINCDALASIDAFEMLVHVADAMMIVAVAATVTGLAVAATITIDYASREVTADRVTIALRSVDGGNFPPFDKVVPKLGRNASKGGVALNARYVADAMAACASASGSGVAALVSLGGKLEPARFDAENSTRSCTVVVSPMRST